MNKNIVSIKAMRLLKKILLNKQGHTDPEYVLPGVALVVAGYILYLLFLSNPFLAVMVGVLMGLSA